MGRQEAAVDARLRAYRDRVARRWRVELFLLFGSRARGDALLTSDYDVIIVSPDFEGVHFLERIRQAFELWDEDLGLDVICYTPAEYEAKRAQIGTVRTASEEGVALA